MTLSRTGNDRPRSSRESADDRPAWTLLLRRASVAFLGEARATGWASRLRAIATSCARGTPFGLGDRRMARHRPRSRMFSPAMDDRLEARALLSGFSSPFGKNYLAQSAFLLKHPSARVAFNLKSPAQLAHNAPHFNNVRGFHRIRYIGTQTAHGGQAVEVTARDGSHYMIKLSYTSNTLATNNAEGQNGQGGVSTAAATTQQVYEQSVNYPQPLGTVRAYPMRGGKTGIIVDGTTDNIELTINPLPRPQRKGFAHSFAYGESTRTHVLNIGKITVTSGEIGAILGFHTADLSGPLVANGTTAIDRIAFDALLPGASIRTGGDVNSLEVGNEINLSGSGTGIFIGRDLNLLNVGTDITLSNGAVIEVGRDLGLVNQPPKGTGTGSNVLTLNFNTLQNTTVTGATIPPSVSTFIQGNVVINPGSVFSIGRNIGNLMYVEGGIGGFSRVEVNQAVVPTSPTFLVGLPPIGSLQPNLVVSLGGGTP